MGKFFGESNDLENIFFVDFAKYLRQNPQYQITKKKIIFIVANKYASCLKEFAIWLSVYPNFFFLN